MDINAIIAATAAKTVAELTVEKVKKIFEEMDRRHALESMVNDFLRTLLKDMVTEALTKEGIIEAAFAEPQAPSLTPPVPPTHVNPEPESALILNSGSEEIWTPGTPETKTDAPKNGSEWINAMKSQLTDGKKDTPPEVGTDEEFHKKKRIQYLHILISDMNDTGKQMKIEYTDEKYRKDLDRIYGVKSSKDLNIEQINDFISYIKDLKDGVEKLLEKAKAKAAADAKATRKAESEVKKAVGMGSKQLSEEAQSVFGEDNGHTFDDSLANRVREATGQPPKDFKDFVGDARKDMLRRNHEAGKPLSVAEYKEIGIDPGTIPDHLIKTFPTGDGQEKLFKDDELPF